MLNDLLNRPEVAGGAALAVALLWIGLAYWRAIWGGVDEVGDRLDGLAVGEVSGVTAVDRYARFEHRDYSHDRGPVQTGPAAPAPIRWVDFYAETVRRLGDPIGGAS